MKKFVVLSALMLASFHIAFGDVVAFWPLDEGEGQTVNDLSGNGYHGVLGSSSAAEELDPTWVTDPNFGTVLEWIGDSGPDQHVDLSAHLDGFRNLNQGTIAAWVKLPGADSVDVILAASDSGSCQWAVLTGQAEYVLHWSTVGRES